LYFFVLIVNPIARPSGKPARQRQRPGKNIALTVKIIINLSFSGTIFYLFAFVKEGAAADLFLIKEMIIKKIAFAASVYTVLAPLNFAARNAIA